MPRLKKTKRKTTSHTIDGVTYTSANLVTVHKELKANTYVTSFTLPTTRKHGKFNSKKAIINNIEFDSIMEARYYAYLLLRVADKTDSLISFERQVKYNLLPKGRNKFTGKAIRETSYIADFVLTYSNNKATEVIDVKGQKTPDFKLKEKMFMLKYPNLDFKCIQYDPVTHDWYELDTLNKIKKQRKTK